MSLKTSQMNFQKAFKEEKKTLTEKLLFELKKYLQARKDKKGYDELWKCMYKNEPLASFLCRNDICDELELEMIRREIPFVNVTSRNGEYGFIVRYSDRLVTNEITRNVLKKMGTYCEMVTGNELVEIEKKQKKGQKGLVAINGLTYKEARTLEKLCKKKGVLEYIAIDRMSDETYRFMVLGTQSMTKNGLVTALFELVMMMEGPNKDYYDRKIESSLSFERLRMNNFSRNIAGFKPLYLVGKCNQYVKILQSGFEYGYAVRQHNEIKLIPQTTMNNGTRGYIECEISYINRIPDPDVIGEDQVIDYFEEANDLREVWVAGVDEEKRNKILGELVLIFAILKVILANVSETDIMNVPERWVEKLELVTYESGKMLSGLISDEIPEGYTELDVQEIKSSISDYDINLNDYSTVSDVLQGLIITNERDSLEIVNADNPDSQTGGFSTSVKYDIDQSENARGVR